MQADPEQRQFVHNNFRKCVRSRCLPEPDFFGYFNYYIIFRVQVEAFVNDKNELENKYRVKVEVFGENESMSTDLRVYCKNDRLMDSGRVRFVCRQNVIAENGRRTVQLA